MPPRCLYASSPERPAIPRSAGGSCAARALVALFAALVGEFVGSGSPAAPIVTGLHFTGENAPAGFGGPDSHWRVEAWPAGASRPGSPGSEPYAAWVMSGTKGFPSVPETWFRSAPGRLASPTIPSSRWIGLQSENAVSVFPDAPYHGPGRSYAAVYSTTFDASEEGRAHLWLLAAPDNAVTFYVNGRLADLDTDHPTIHGGSLLGSRVQGLSRLHAVAGAVDVHAGTNTLFAVVEDVQGPSGTYGATGLLVVPEPSTAAGLAAAAVCLGAAALRRPLTRPLTRRSRGRTRRGADGAASGPPRAGACSGSSARRRRG